MTKTELKEARERYLQLSHHIRTLTADALVKETADEQEARIKMLLRPENYIKFFDFYFGIDSGLPLADAPSAKFHQKSYEKVFADPFIIQFRRWFRGAAKSLHTNVGNMLHLKQNDELNFAVIVGRNENMAKILLQDVQVHLESNELFNKDFGNQVSYGSWADGIFESTDNKHFKALGINQPFRGLRFGAARPDFASVDDVEDRDQAKNKDMVRKYGDKITGDLMKAFHFRRGRMIIPQNYIVKDGINDYVLNKKKDSKHLHVSTINLSDKKENPSWPERITKEDVKRINEDTDYYTSQREDYNNPIEEGKLFKAAQMIKRNVHHREAWDGLLAHWDLSYTSTGDYKAGILLGVQGLRLTVLEVFCQRCDINSAMEKHFEWVFKYKAKGYSPLSFFDATAAQNAVYSPIILQCAEDNECPDIPMPMHQEGDKHNRIETVVTNALHRKILFWDDLLEGKDYKAFMDQVLAFEKGVKTDDAPDTLERAISLAQKFFGYSKDEKSQKPLIGKRKKRRV
jgi:hypothetical protein